MLSPSARDRIYLIFLAVHIPATLLVDVQALFCAERLSPAWLRKAFLFAAQDDPLLQNANAPLFAWFQAFIILEVLFQVPVFFLGVQGLWKRDASIWPLLAIYGASSSTTTFACLATVLTMPGIKPEHLVKLLASYVPFFLVPLAMTVDYGVRLTSLMGDRVNEKLVKAAAKPDTVPDPDRARALVTYARAVMFISKRVRNSSDAKRNPDMSVTDWAAFVSVVLQTGHSNLDTHGISPALLASTLHHVTVFATINDLHTGRQKLAPGVTLNRNFVLASFKAMVNPLIPALDFQSAKEAIEEIDFLVVLDGRDCGFGCIMLLDPTLTNLLKLECTFGPTPHGAAWIART
ncbi:hypothetical protein JCM3774_006653 [Rhodotorula dairenensis]